MHPDDPAVREVLAHGRIEVEGRLVEASNATLFCSVEHEGVAAECVYKPVRGERPLWDFPDGTLAEREVAAYEVSAAAGWGIVPPTVYRDGPAGPGMVQLWIDVDESVVLDDTEEGPDAVRVFLSPGDARAFAERAERVLNAGRKPCPLCGEPLDPEGHICPRQNGYRRSEED